MPMFWNFKNLSDEEAELRIDGEIVEDSWAWIYEWFGEPHAAPNKFRKALAEHKGKNLTVWIDSWGGDVFAGVGMYNALKEHKGKVTVKVDGKAVSAGSLIAMAGDEILMSPGSIMMIHNPWTRTVGEAKDMRHAADVLDEVKEAILNIYQSRVKSKTREEIAKLMDNEEWMSARKAVAEGFADSVLHMEDEDAVISASYSISRLAIQNSASAAMQRFFEQWQKMQTANEPDDPAPQNPDKDPVNSRVFDIQRRVSVREKSLRRYV